MNAEQEAARAIVAAIRNEGRVPWVHRYMMEKQRREWPSLWAAIDSLLEAVPNEDLR